MDLYAGHSTICGLFVVLSTIQVIIASQRAIFQQIDLFVSMDKISTYALGHANIELGADRSS
jgi:hypothetical protein